MTRSWFPRTIVLLMICSGLALICRPAWCQKEAPETDADAGSGADAQLLIPPAVSNQSYPTEFAGDTEQNYLRGGFTFSSAYTSNVTGTSNSPTGDMSYSLWPNLAINRVTPTLHLVFSYSPGFTIYQKTSAYDQANQNLAFALQDRISPRLSLSLQETFQKSSNVFDRPTPLGASALSGAPPATGLGVIPPLANQNDNATSAQLAYQLGETSSLGVTGNYVTLRYP